MLPAPALGVLLAVLARLPVDAAPACGDGSAADAQGPGEGRGGGAAAGSRARVVAQAALKLAQVLAMVPGVWDTCSAGGQMQQQASVVQFLHSY